MAQKEGEKEMIDPHSHPEVEGAIVFNGHDNAIIGYGQRINMEPVLIYDYEIICHNLQHQNMTEEEAIEYAEYNIVGAWLGDRTPIIFYRLPV